MKRRIMSILLVLALAISMISCGGTKQSSTNTKKEELNVKALLDSISDMKAKSGEFTMDFDISDPSLKTQLGLDSLKFAIKASCIQKDEKNSQVNLSYKVGEGSDYKALTSFLTKDNKTIYIDFATLKKALIDVFNTYKVSEAIAMISILPEANYLKIDIEQLTSYTKSISGVQGNMTALEMEDPEKAQKVITTAAQYILTTMQEATKDVKPVFLSGSDKELKVEISNKNLIPVCEALSKLDIDAKYDELVNKVKAVDSNEEYTKEFTTNKSQIVSEIKETLEKAKSNKENKDEFKVECETKVSGEKGNRTFACKFTAAGVEKTTKVNMTLEMTVCEKEASDAMISVPTDAVDIMEYIGNVSKMLKQ